MPALVSRGMRPDDFWSLSWLELNDVLEYMSLDRKMRAKEMASLVFTLGDVIWNRMTMLLVEKKDQPEIIRPWDIYPDLFEDEKEKSEEYQAQREVAKQVSERERYVIAMNEKRRRELTDATS